ncbi:MAG: nitrate/nitrite transporter NrtS [Gammaproteobacteria bacterium]|nr:nitrate/nitrite transporter NrtS [Gammaproteobacteria bacterium]
MSDRSWITDALQPAVRRRAAHVSLIVGTVLVIINHGHALIDGDVTTVRCAQMLLTYAVPYAVSTYAAVGALRDRCTDAP